MGRTRSSCGTVHGSLLEAENAVNMHFIKFTRNRYQEFDEKAETRYDNAGSIFHASKPC